MTSASPKAELVFSYKRDEKGAYQGSVSVEDTATGESLRPPLGVVLTRPEWVRFVVDTIRQHPDISKVSFDLKKPDKTSFRHQIDPRTIERIKDATFNVDDLIL